MNLQIESLLNVFKGLDVETRRNLIPKLIELADIVC